MLSVATAAPTTLSALHRRPLVDPNTLLYILIGLIFALVVVISG
jgi:hypothetical protein